MNCPFCDEDIGTKHFEHVAECYLAPEDVREDATKALATRKAYVSQPILCCKMRKKILLKPILIPEQDCGIPDSETLDFMTFEMFLGRPVIAPRFCSWCGKPWIVQGIKVV